jgi:hypothetical protein
MKYVSKKVLLLAGVIITLLYLNSCSKSTPDPAPASTDPCVGKTITITATGTASSGCAINGSISVSATGSTGFTFKLNSGGAYQASGSFTNVSPGTYTVYAKDAAGCEKTSTVSVTAGTKGPLFTLVKNLVTAKCQSCHNNSIQNGSMNFETDCSIVNNQARIKVRAVDEGTMPTGGPSLTVSEKAVITNWITAGGRLTD